MTTGRQKVLEAATQAVMKDRNAEYAPPEQNFQRIADFWNTYLEGRRITSYDVAIMCGLIKVARAISSPQQIDHLVDLAGYAACAGDIVVADEVVPDLEPEDPGHWQYTMSDGGVTIIEPIEPGPQVRCMYEGEPGQFNEPADLTWYSDGGRKVTMTYDQWGEALTQGALVYPEMI